MEGKINVIYIAASRASSGCWRRTVPHSLAIAVRPPCRLLRRAAVRFKSCLTVLLTATLLGCVTTPEPITETERAQRISADLAELFAGNEPVTESITLADAMARAIKYNLDYRVRLMETAVAMRNVNVAAMDLLPNLTVSAGYFDRNNDSGGSSQSLLSGEQSLEPSTSQERERVLSGLRVAWNVLDFGVSYVTAKQRQDEVLIAEEQKRKAIQNIMQEVTDAYWRAWSAQELVGQIQELVIHSDSAIEKSRVLAAGGLQRQKDALLYQRQLLEIRTELLDLQDSLVMAKTRLAGLMSLRPGTRYTIAPPEPDLPRPFNVSVDQMELSALLDRPELYEEDYRLRIKQHDVRKSILRMFPGIEITAGTQHDTNKFLFNSSWRDVSLRLSWNLFNVFGATAAKKYHESEVLLADLRRLALSMAVMTQVRLALQRYELARVRYEAAADVANVNEHYLQMVAMDNQTQTAFDVIQARATSLNSLVRKHLAYAETQNALARVFNSIGVDPLPKAVKSHELASLSDAIEQHSAYLIKTHLQPASPSDPKKEVLELETLVKDDSRNGPFAKRYLGPAHIERSPASLSTEVLEWSGIGSASASNARSAMVTWPAHAGPAHADRVPPMLVYIKRDSEFQRVRGWRMSGMQPHDALDFDALWSGHVPAAPNSTETGPVYMRDWRIKGASLVANDQSAGDEKPSWQKARTTPSNRAQDPPGPSKGWRSSQPAPFEGAEHTDPIVGWIYTRPASIDRNPGSTQ